MARRILSRIRKMSIISIKANIEYNKEMIRMEKTKVAYICSPYKGEDKSEEISNVRRAIEISRAAYAEGYVPIVVHAFLQDATGTTEETDRKALLRAGKAILTKCDVIIINKDQPISQGMIEEIMLAEALQIPKIHYKKGELIQVN